MSGRNAARHSSSIAAQVETEPLFSADEDGYDVAYVGNGDNSNSDASRHKETVAAAGDNPTNSRYPPAKYLKSTFTSREHEFDASDDFIEPAEVDQTLLTGLLETARSRGSIEVHRRPAATTNQGAGNDAEDPGLEHGLIVGIGQAGGGMLASVS